MQNGYFGDGYFSAEYKATILSYIVQYVIPAGAQAASNNPQTPQAGVELYHYYLPCATEGKVVEVEIEIDTSDNGLVFWVATSEVAAQ